MTLQYVHLSNGGLDGCTADRHWRESVAISAPWFCAACVSVRGDQPGPIDVYIQERRPPGSPVQSVLACGLLVVSKRVIDLFPQPVVDRDLWLGAVVGPAGRFDNWLSVRSRRRVFVRGEARVARPPLRTTARFDASLAGSRRCETCGRDVYYGVGKRYIYPSPSTDAHLFESHRGLVVHPTLSNLVESLAAKHLKREMLDVAPAPRDGFGELAW